MTGSLREWYREVMQAICISSFSLCCLINLLFSIALLVLVLVALACVCYVYKVNSSNLLTCILISLKKKSCVGKGKVGKRLAK